MTDQKCVGYIQLVFFDDIQGETICLGGAGFVSVKEDETTWAAIPEFADMSSFMVVAHVL